MCTSQQCVYLMILAKACFDSCVDLQKGLALSVRNLSTMGAIVFGTTLVSGMGTVSLAAHEIMRQVRVPACHFAFPLHCLMYLSTH